MLNKEEYVEQEFFFRSFSEQLKDGFSSQEILAAMQNTLLSTTDLWKTIDFLITEIRHSGSIGEAMKHLPHYYTAFQTFIVRESEKAGGRFDFKIALKILEREAKYLSGDPVPQGIFFYQFETLSRNRLGFDHGLEAISKDPIFDENWRNWINIVLRRQIGIIDLANLVYVRSSAYERTEEEKDAPLLFGDREGKIAHASRKKDPAFLFAALARHLNYPAVPHQEKAKDQENLVPLLKRRIDLLESKLQILEEELHGGINLDRFYVKKN
ncbi:MAG: hypothetical protein Q4G69_06810 [Planctomycetia bacterium]|nr:hypothetical protein [Planctomycetia bacterium]